MTEYWKQTRRGREFLPGRDAPDEAEAAAKECGSFIRDYEEECIFEDAVSCYDCRYRRWTAESFECMKKTV